MATKRMFAAVVVGDDKYRLMSLGAQALYFTLGMEADDYGIVGSPVGWQRAIGAPETAFDELIEHGLILVVDHCVVIRHWNVNNTLRNDRGAQTNYPDVLAEIEQDKKGVYWMRGEVPDGLQNNDGQETDNGMATDSQVDVNGMSAVCQVTDNGMASDAVEEEERRIYSSSPPIIPPANGGGEKTETEILTEEERERLLILMDRDSITLNYYLDKMRSFVAEEGKTYRNPAATIEKWYRQDHDPPRRGKRRREEKDGGSFDTDEFFNAAVSRSYQSTGGGET